MTIDDVREVRFRRLLCTVSRANCAMFFDICAMFFDMSRTAAGGRWNGRRRSQLAAENHAQEMRGRRLQPSRGGRYLECGVQVEIGAEMRRRRRRQQTPGLLGGMMLH